MSSSIALRLIVALVSSPAHAAPSEISGKVVGVADGDTLTILDSNRQQHRIRLADIDAPESSQDFGWVSKRSLSDMAFGEMAQATCKEEDRYGRSICRVLVKGINVNIEQVARGLAWVYLQYAPKSSVLYTYEEKAKLERKGLWNDKSPTPPWEYRRERK